MVRVFAVITLAALLAALLPAQTPEPRPVFEAADVRASKDLSQYRLGLRTGIRSGRYELHGATMVDLIRTAYGVDPEKVFGGPSWLEFDRFEITASASPNTSEDTLKLMLRSLLADRFKLVVHNDTKPVTGYALSMGKGKPKLKESDGSGKKGCESQRLPPAAPAPGQAYVPLTSITCHNTTMAEFVSQLKGEPGGGYITNTAVDSTGLKGSWDFEYRLTVRTPFTMLAAPDGVTLADAIENQLGLKLEERKFPTAVIVVDRVNEKPTDNPPDIAKKLHLPPAEFEVVDIKPVGPNSIVSAPGTQGLGGRINLPGQIFSLLGVIELAWNLTSPNDLADAPTWLNNARFDILAKVPQAFLSLNGTAPDIQDLGPMFQTMLIDRFKMKAHFEDRPVKAYTLVSVKPKMKKADPEIRTNCKTKAGGTPNGGFLGLTRTLTCQNITMTQLADKLQSDARPYVHYPVTNGTNLEGGWDFTLTYSSVPDSRFSEPAGANPFGGAASSDPPGHISLFDAIEKQLGLKLEPQERMYPVLVIDHIEEKPTDN